MVAAACDLPIANTGRHAAASPLGRREQDAQARLGPLDHAAKVHTRLDGRADAVTARRLLEERVLLHLEGRELVRTP